MLTKNRTEGGTPDGKNRLAETKQQREKAGAEKKQTKKTDPGADTGGVRTAAGCCGDYGFLPRAEDKTVLSGEKLPAAETDVFSGEDRERETEAESGWQLMLVNRDHPLPEDYQVELTELANGKSVDSRIYPALQQMFDDARSQGIYPVVASGYRTEADQERIMEEKVQEFQDQGYSREEAQQEAQNWVALPGTSEHQLGSAVDINADGIHSYGDEVYAWLNENSWRYGFIQRYPLDKTDITGISYEPWHYRYVGKQAAREIYERGICLEEYLELE